MSIAQTWLGFFQLAQEIGINLVARRGFAGVRAAVNCLDSHALHQSRDMAAANQNPFAVQHVAQHSTARERVIEMQFVEPPHDFQIRGRYGPRLVIYGAPANAERLRLPGDREGRGPCRSSLCAQHAGLGERAFQKIILQRQFADLGVERFQIDGGLSRVALLLAEHAGRAFEKLALPRRDLVRMNIELLRQIA